MGQDVLGVGQRRLGRRAAAGGEERRHEGDDEQEATGHQVFSVLSDPVRRVVRAWWTMIGRWTTALGPSGSVAARLVTVTGLMVPPRASESTRPATAPRASAAQ